MRGVLIVGAGRKKKKNAPVRMINIGLRSHQVLLPRFVRQVSADLVAVFLRLEERDEVDAGPHLFTTEFTAKEEKKKRRWEFGRWLALHL